MRALRVLFNLFFRLFLRYGYNFEDLRSQLSFNKRTISLSSVNIYKWSMQPILWTMQKCQLTVTQRNWLSYLQGKRVFDNFLCENQITWARLRDWRRVLNRICEQDFILVKMLKILPLNYPSTNTSTAVAVFDLVI